MNTKLTLRLNEEVIRQIKNYALKQKLSVSKITEDLFRKVLDSSENYNKNLTPIVQKYKGIIAESDIKEDELLLKSLEEKHSQNG